MQKNYNIFFHIKHKILHAFVFLFFFSGQLNAQIAQGKCKFLGNVINSNIPTDFETYWNQVTPENAGKWQYTEATRDRMTGSSLTNIYNYAIDHGFPFKQHTFVWDNQKPNWIDGLTAEEQKAEVEEWIKWYGTNFPLTDFIDVVNEPLHAPPTFKGALGGDGVTGWDWVIWSFKKARQYCPNAKLILNDYNIINDNSATTQFLEIINILKDSSLIDGIGEQGHFMETTNINTISNNLNRLSATGLPIYISEYDVNIADDVAQSEKLFEQLLVIWPHPGVYGITMWGYKEGAIWRENAFLLNSNGTERPSMNTLDVYVRSTDLGLTCVSDIKTSTVDRLNIHIFPNPVDADKSITIESSERIFLIRIYDITGRIKQELKGEMEFSQILTIDLNKGIYLIEINTEKNTVLTKLAVK